MANSQAKLLYPGLAGFYESVLPIAETFLRIVIGVMFVMHVSGKLSSGPGAVAANVMSKNGLEPAIFWAYVVIFLELVGGICLIIGLFTRLATLPLLGMTAVIEIFVYPQNWPEHLTWATLLLFLLLRGAGDFSVDRLIGRADDSTNRERE